MSRYRNLQPKYLNTDVNASTVKHLLQTVNSISKQCKAQYANEDDLERVRSIIYLYRPHLRLRYDLHVPELVMEALMPNSTLSNNTPNQITHNFNYKYDYNTNYPIPTIVPAPVTNVDPFGVPVISQVPQPQTTIAPTTVPVQNYYINAPPNNGSNVPLQSAANTGFMSTQQMPPQMYVQQQQQQQPMQLQIPQQQQQYPMSSSTGRPPSPPPPAASVAIQLIGFNPDDVAAIENQYRIASSGPSTQSYHDLINVLFLVSRKYIRTQIFIQSLTLINNFDHLENDLKAVVAAINIRTSMQLNYSSPNIASAIAIIIQQYFRVVYAVFNNINNTIDYRLLGSEQEYIDLTTQIIDIIKGNQTELTRCNTKYNELTQPIYNYLKSKNYNETDILNYIVELESKLNGLEFTNNRLESTINDLKNQIPSVHMETSSIESLEKLNKNLNLRLQSLNTDIGRIKNILSENNIITDDPISTFIGEYNKLKENLERVPDVIKMRSQFEDEINELKQAFEEKMKNLNIEMSTLQDINTELTEKNQALSTENQALSTENQTLFTQNQTLSAENKSLSTQSQTLSTQNLTLSTKNQQQLELINDLQNAIRTTQKTAYVSPTQPQQSSAAESNDITNDLQNQLEEKDKLIAQLTSLQDAQLTPLPQTDKKQKFKSLRNKQSTPYDRPTTTEIENDIIKHTKTIMSGQEALYIEENKNLTSSLNQQISANKLLQLDIQNIKNSLERAINTSAIGPDFVALNRTIDEQTVPYVELEQKYNNLKQITAQSIQEQIDNASVNINATFEALQTDIKRFEVLARNNAKEKINSNLKT